MVVLRGLVNNLANDGQFDSGNSLVDISFYQYFCRYVTKNVCEGEAWYYNANLRFHNFLSAYVR